MSGYAHLNAPEGTAHNQMMCFVVIPLLIRKRKMRAHSQQRCMPRQLLLPGSCLGCVPLRCSPLSSARNANWSRIAQLTRSDRCRLRLWQVRVMLGHFLAVSENSEPRGAGPAASEAVWTAERTNVFNKLYLQIDSRLLPRRRRGRTRTPCGTRCRSVARSHMIPAYRPPHLIVNGNSRRRTASPRSASIT